MRRLLRNRKGQGLVEYGLIIAGVALACAAAISVFGNKVNDLIAATAAVLPGSSAADNQPILSGQLIETIVNEDGNIVLDVERIANQAVGTPRLGINFGLPEPNNFGGLVIDAQSLASGGG